MLWYAGYHPRSRITEKRSTVRRTQRKSYCTREVDRVDALVAHGYFNFLIGRDLGRRGFRKLGVHRARFWNAVIYEKRDV